MNRYIIEIMRKIKIPNYHTNNAESLFIDLKYLKKTLLSKMIVILKYVRLEVGKNSTNIM